jgi:large subunit ribosomal protein L15
MTKLNEIRENDGAAKKRMRVGRGPGSGKGKTAGRGVKGQKARSGVAIAGFEGGQMPLHMRMPKRGFNNPFRKEFAEVNLWRIAQAIEAGKLDPTQVIDAAALIKSGVLRRAKDGVRLLGKGELKTKVELSIHSASVSARAAIEAAGGKLTTVLAAAAPDAEGSEAEAPAAKAPKGKGAKAKAPKA